MNIATQKESETVKTKNTKFRRFAVILLCIPFATGVFWFQPLLNFINDTTSEPLACTIESAEVDSSTGGPRSATKHESVFIYTSDCGMIYISRLHNMDVSSFEELSTKINEHEGQTLTFHIGKLQLSSDSTRAERVDF